MKHELRKKITPSISKCMSILKNNFVSQYLSLSSFNATLINYCLVNNTLAYLL